MNKIKKGFTYDQVNLDFLNDFFSCSNKKSSNSKVNEILFTFNNMLKHTKKELVNIFTKDEILLLSEVMKSNIYTASISAKYFISSKVKDGILFEKLDKNYQVSSENLLNKIEKLTEFQAYTILYMIVECLNDKNRSIEDIFLIRN